MLSLRECPFMFITKVFVYSYWALKEMDSCNMDRSSVLLVVADSEVPTSCRPEYDELFSHRTPSGIIY
jgi:hypothetical protein